jgi:hypothetical protein
MAESFVNTFKRDYVSRMDLTDARTVMAQLPEAFGHFNEVHPHGVSSSQATPAAVDKSPSASNTKIQTAPPYVIRHQGEEKSKTRGRCVALRVLIVQAFGGQFTSLGHDAPRQRAAVQGRNCRATFHLYKNDIDLKNHVSRLLHNGNRATLCPRLSCAPRHARPDLQLRK